MIFQVPYACPMDVIPARARNVVRQYVRREMPVDIPERPKGHLRTAAQIYFRDSKKGFGVLQDDGGRFYMQTYLIAEPLPPDLPLELGPIRRLAKDWQEETEARIGAKASEMIYMDGVLHRPIPEPYMSLEVSWSKARIVVHTDGLRHPGYYPTFRMDQIEEAKAELADRVAAFEHRPRDFKVEETSVIVTEGVTCRHEQEPSAIVFAATQLIDIVQNVVGKLPTNQIMSWTALRDLNQLQAETGRIDLDVLSQQLVMTYEDLAKTPALKRYNQGRVVKQLIDEYARPRMAQGLKDLSIPM